MSDPRLRPASGAWANGHAEPMMPAMTTRWADPAEAPAPADGLYAWVTRLVHQHRAHLIRVVRREGLRAADALDCVQDAFLGFLTLPQARLLVDLPDDSAKMLTILARNIARNRRRRHDYAKPHAADDATLHGLPSDAVPADELVAAAERHALLLGCMATLSEVQRAVVNLRLVDEVPGEDVARQLGTDAGHVAVLLFRAKRSLRSCLAGIGEMPAMTAGGG
jgi:RNA polymerase sigma-70 factor, ECF subfamily